MTEVVQLAYSDKLPEDLRALLTIQKVPPDDPLIALLAWHWLRINESRDVIQNSASQLGSTLEERRAAMQEIMLQLEALLGARLKDFTGFAGTLDSIFGHLGDLSEVLSKQPLGISQRITEELAHPISQSVSLVKQLSVDASGLITDVDTSRKRLIWTYVVTAFLCGYATGTLIISWIYSHIFWR